MRGLFDSTDVQDGGSIQHTVRYTELAPTRFKSLFRD
jgi:hypothetical protein